MADGRFIVLEGLDGSGITTQTEYLRMRCEKEGIPISVTKEPSDGPAGGIIKWVLRHELVGLPAESLALLFAADRQHHVAHEIAPALSAGTTVICDRYHLSSFAYQSVEVEDLKWLREINSKCLAPDLTIYLDVPPKECLERMTSDVWRGLDKLQLYEELSRLEQVRERFLSVIDTLQRDGHDIVVVDGIQEVGAVAADVLTAASKVLGQLNRESQDDMTRSKGTKQIAAILDAGPTAR